MYVCMYVCIYIYTYIYIYKYKYVIIGYVLLVKCSKLSINNRVIYTRMIKK